MVRHLSHHKKHAAECKKASPSSLGTAQSNMSNKNQQTTRLLTGMECKVQ